MTAALDCEFHRSVSFWNGADNYRLVERRHIFRRIAAESHGELLVAEDSEVPSDSHRVPTASRRRRRRSDRDGQVMASCDEHWSAENLSFGKRDAKMKRGLAEMF